jgi:pimeloyl-ACP methyl ester carboxylesterase
MPLVRAGDLDVHYLERGSGVPVVLVHGNWATSSWWEPVLGRVPDGVRALAPDLRGRGKTRGGLADHRIATYAADLRAFVDALGLGTFALVGHSLGSAVALEFALTWPERLTSLVAVSPAWIDGMPQAYATPDRQRQLKADPAFLRAALRAIVPGAPEDALWDRVVAEGSEQSIEAALGLIPALLEWKPGDRVATIAVPRVVISGSLDAFTGGPNAERVARALGCDLVTMEGVGHGPMLEAPDGFCELLWARISPAPDRAGGN